MRRVTSLFTNQILLAINVLLGDVYASTNKQKEHDWAMYKISQRETKFGIPNLTQFNDMSKVITPKNGGDRQLYADLLHTSC